MVTSNAVDVVIETPSSLTSTAAALPPRVLFALWVLSGALLLLFLSSAPVQRTQEARVLETAREMLGKDARDWIIPKLNGQIRLRKPPIAYWLSAVSFKLFGISAAAGRIP